MNEVAAKKKGLPTWVIVLIVIAAAGPVVLGIVAALSIYGVRKYVMQAKRQEAMQLLTVWGTGMVHCAEKEGHLPPSSAPVPATLGAISARKYQSAASDWAEPAFTCSGFAVAEPQYFQYQWERTTDSQGVLHAVADLNGDGTPDESFEARISCSGASCTATAPAKL